MLIYQRPCYIFSPCGPCYIFSACGPCSCVACHLDHHIFEPWSVDRFAYLIVWNTIQLCYKIEVEHVVWKTIKKHQHFKKNHKTYSVNPRPPGGIPILLAALDFKLGALGSIFESLGCIFVPFGPFYTKLIPKSEFERSQKTPEMKKCLLRANHENIYNSLYKNDILKVLNNPFQLNGSIFWAWLARRSKFLCSPNVFFAKPHKNGAAGATLI